MPHSTHAQLLSQCSAGQVSQITALKGKTELKMRLVHLGFHTHSIVECISRYGQNIVVSVDGSHFAMDQSIAAYIQVEPLS